MLYVSLCQHGLATLKRHIFTYIAWLPLLFNNVYVSIRICHVTLTNSVHSARRCASFLSVGNVMSASGGSHMQREVSYCTREPGKTLPSTILAQVYRCDSY